MLADSPLPIFISYSHKDSEYLNRLLIFLKPLERLGSVHAWNDTRIKAGQIWKQEIDSALQSAKAAILLISADFLASDFIFEAELPVLLAAAEDRGVLIVPVFVGHCQYDLYPDLEKFQGINSPSHPLSDLTDSERDKVWNEVAKRVRAHLASFP